MSGPPHPNAMLARVLPLFRTGAHGIWGPRVGQRPTQCASVFTAAAEALNKVTDAFFSSFFVVILLLLVLFDSHMPF